ncbi:uncharacterized protein LOC107465740 [Arachis duranensis]|uniref:Uncharacterized protein LOC107465740 n=1 Tax=Arachis duranensis TaxID=130453 RepID=A0A6P4BI09_ARADU|nr:uncharacterized protein LOC107465740 [Arachis duranensis]
MRFEIPEIVISDNSTQFIDKQFREYLEGLSILQKFISIEHRQTNGQVEAANKIILKGLKKMLDKSKGSWADEFGSVLWSYRTSLQTSTEESHFRITYGFEVVIPIEVGQSSPRRTLGGHDEDTE